MLGAARLLADLNLHPEWTLSVAAHGVPSRRGFLQEAEGILQSFHRLETPSWNPAPFANQKSFRDDVPTHNAPGQKRSEVFGRDRRVIWFHDLPPFHELRAIHPLQR